MGTTDINELIELIKPLITEEGLKISGNGIVIQELNKINKTLLNLDKKLYYMESRQKDTEQLLEEIIKLQKSLNTKDN